MNFASDKADLLQMVDFFESLFKVLVEQVPDRRAQFRRVLDSDVLPRLHKLRGSLQNIANESDDNWKQLHEHGLDGESLRLKYDELEDSAHKGLLKKTFGLSNVVIESLTDIFGFLKAVKEFKGLLEQKLVSEPEPFPYLTTLFGPGPIPGPPSGAQPPNTPAPPVPGLTATAGDVEQRQDPERSEETKTLPDKTNASPPANKGQPPRPVAPNVQERVDAAKVIRGPKAPKG